MRKLLYQLKYLYTTYITNNILINILFSPLKFPSLQYYFGKIRIGTPYFYPRRWKKTKNGHTPITCKYFKIDIVNLGYKTKWSDTDYRFEWSPLLSIVICKKQFCIFIVPPIDNNIPYLNDQYWITYLLYKNNTNKKLNTYKRTVELITKFPSKLIYWNNNKKDVVYPYKHILKKKYIDLYNNYNKDDITIHDDSKDL